MRNMGMLLILVAYHETLRARSLLLSLDGGTKSSSVSRCLSSVGLLWVNLRSQVGHKSALESVKKIQHRSSKSLNRRDGLRCCNPHNPKVAGSNPAPATTYTQGTGFHFCKS